MRQPKCKPGDHIDRPLRRGSKRVRCTKCGDMFPCHHDCDHLDCLLERGEKLPEWAGGPEKLSSSSHKDRCAPEPGTSSPALDDRGVASPILPIPSARHEQ